MGFFYGIVSGLTVAVQQAQHRHHPADRTANLPHSAHAAAEGGGKPGGKILTQSRYIAKRHRNGLGTIVALTKKFRGIGTVIHVFGLLFFRFSYYITAEFQLQGMKKPQPPFQGLRQRLSKNPFGLFRQFFAVCRAHNLFATGE